MILLVLLLIGIVAFCSAQDQEIHKNCSELSAPGHYPDYEPAPNYKIDNRYETSVKPPTLVLQISVSPQSLSGTEMTRLGCRLNADFPTQKRIYVLIFDDRKSAASLAVGATDEKDYGTFLWHLRGRYELDREKKIQFVEFLVPFFEDQLLSLQRYKVWLTP